MRYNITRHFLLKKFTEKFLHNYEEDGTLYASTVGLSNIEIDDLLKGKKKHKRIILSELQNSGEIEKFNLHGLKGYFITDAVGLSAFNEKKYLNRNNDILLLYLKNIVQIFIPIASLMVAVLALTIKANEINNSQINKINDLNSRLKVLERKTESKTSGNSG